MCQISGTVANVNLNSLTGNKMNICSALLSSANNVEINCFSVQSNYGILQLIDHQSLVKIIELPVSILVRVQWARLTLGLTPLIHCAGFISLSRFPGMLP